MTYALDGLEPDDLALLADAMRVKIISKQSAYAHCARTGSSFAIVRIAQELARVETMLERVRALIDRANHDASAPVADCHLCRLRETAKKL